MPADKAAEKQAYVKQARKPKKATSAFEKAVSGREPKKPQSTK